MYFIDYDKQVLAHYGVKGMKWDQSKRKYRDRDGNYDLRNFSGPIPLQRGTSTGTIDSFYQVGKHNVGETYNTTYTDHKGNMVSIQNRSKKARDINKKIIDQRIREANMSSSPIHRTIRTGKRIVSKFLKNIFK